MILIAKSFATASILILAAAGVQAFTPSPEHYVMVDTGASSSLVLGE